MPGALRDGVPIILPAAVLVFLAHLAMNAHYGFFRDELYFIICGRHPALGYVDQPPLVPLLAALSQSTGISLFALRAIPALFAAVAAFAASTLAIEFGGGALAVGLCCLCVACSPVLMAFGARLSPDTLQMALWPLVALVFVRIARGAHPRYWLVAGALTGVAWLAKYSIVFFVAATIAALLCTPQRRILFSWWFAAGAVLSLAIAAPNVLWQWQYHWPMISLLEADKGRPVLSMLYPLQQVMITGPVFAVVWIWGLVSLSRRRELRFLTIAYLFLIAIMWLLHGKNYYPAPAYPIFFAAGSVPVARALRGRPVASALAYTSLVLSTFASLPFIEPILPLQTYIAYQQALGRALHSRTNAYAASDRTPIDYYADMTGWPQMAARVRAVYDALPPKERSHSAIFTGNTGEASAIEFFAGSQLPPVISGNDNYYLWGTRGASGRIVIDVNAPKLLSNYRSVTLAGYVENPTAMPYEQHRPIWILRESKRPLAEFWPNVRDYSYLTADALK